MVAVSTAGDWSLGSDRSGNLATSRSTSLFGRFASELLTVEPVDFVTHITGLSVLVPLFGAALVNPILAD